MPDRRHVAVALRIDEAYPHHQEVLAGVLDYAREHPGWECVIDEHPGYQPRARTSPAQRYDGVIARAAPATQRRLKKHGIPLVNTWYQHAGPGVAGVYVDMERIGRLAAEHLLERGLRRLAFFGIEGFRQGEMIGRAFAQRTEEEGHACSVEQVGDGSYDDRKYWLALNRQLERFLGGVTPPVGVMTLVPWLGRLLTTRCRDRGWRVPHDIALVCLDDVASIVEVPPRMTCVDSQYQRVGYEAAALLERLMAGQPPPSTPILVPPRGMIARESTDHLAVEDELVAGALRYISEHLEGRLRLEEIAQAVAVSPRSLQRRFEATLGRPVSDEIRRLRLTKAKRLLGEKDVQIQQVARTTGFGSSVVLNQVFRRELGMTPSDYRKRTLGAKGQR